MYHSNYGGKKMRRKLAVLLAVLLTVSLIPVSPALADDQVPGTAQIPADEEFTGGGSEL